MRMPVKSFHASFVVLSLLSVALVVRPTTLAAASPSAAVLHDESSSEQSAFANDISKLVATAGYSVQHLAPGLLVKSDELTTGKYDLLVLPDARVLPVAACDKVQNYLKEGGDLLALGLAAWKSPQFEINGRWLTHAQIEQQLAAACPHHVLFDFAHDDLTKWTRGADDVHTSARHEVTTTDSGKALHVVIERYPGWETFASPPLANPFANGQTLTCFRAKGGPHTKQLAIEWTERDGSRWIATVNLKTTWQEYRLPPEAFKAWQPPPQRSGKNDILNVKDAVRLVVGVAQSHTALEGNHHEYWIADIGAATNPFGETRLPTDFTPPHIECLCPTYQFFPIHAGDESNLKITSLATAVESHSKQPSQDFIWHVDPQSSAQQLFGMHPRPHVGFNQRRSYRWEPLLAALDSATGDYRGAIAALLVHNERPYRGGVWAAFTPNDAKFYQQPAVAQCLQQTLVRMRRGVFLVEGGAEYFTVFPNQEFAVGANVVNTSKETAAGVTTSLEISDGKSARRLKEMILSLAPDTNQVVEQKATVERDNEKYVTVTVRQNGQVIDSLHHEIGVWRPNPEPHYIAARDGGLWLDGKPWKAHGVNYLPSSCIGLANWHHFEHWVGRGAYDPEIIERDLGRIQAMNLNAVSVFVYYESLNTQHMLDFLRRCEAHHLKVNLSLRPGTPLDFRWNEIREMIERLHLAENDTVFAYDLAWEPHHEPQALQTDYAQPWRTWIDKHHGDLTAAQHAWRADANGSDFRPKESEILPAPPIKWFTHDGPWRKLIADYRHFMDDLLAERYATARKLVKSVDPHHAVSFRMQLAGDPTYNDKTFLAYDFFGLADAVDIWEPEAYGRIGNWERVKPGHFTAAFARLCDAKKPVVWAEMGTSVWGNTSMAPDAKKLAFQASFFRDFYRMMTDSGADGVFFWWYPGGYRLNEQSDYGIIDPDGTDRPVTRVIRTDGAHFMTSPKRPTEPNYSIEVDRDRDARGLYGIYETVSAEYWQAVKNDKVPGLKWKHKPGQLADK